VTKGPSRRNGPAISANDAARPARRQRASPMLNLMTTVMLNVVVNPHLISRVERSVAEVEASRASAASAAQQKEEEEVEVELEDSKKKKSCRVMTQEELRLINATEHARHRYKLSLVNVLFTVTKIELEFRKKGGNVLCAEMCCAVQ
jgi:hypothetical protein